MANTVISPNMSLPVPVVSVDPGPDWANNVNSCFSVIDGHNHAPGSGVQITPSGMNISSDLTFNSNNATSLRSTRWSAQGSPLSAGTDVGCAYVSGVDLYFNDLNGNQVRITQSGSVTGATGTITGLPSGTASASYSAGVFSFQSATNTPAKLNIGSVNIGQQVASGYDVNIAASGSQGANYNLVLPPALPASSSSLVSDASGNLSFVGLNFGTYTPTLTNSSGTGTFITYVTQYFVVGTMVWVFGNCSINSFSAPASCTMTLPISPTIFTQTYQAGGSTSPLAGSAYQVLANVGGTTVIFYSTGTPANGVQTFGFGYRL